MIKTLVGFIHHLFDPHCSHCIDAKVRDQQFELLRQQCPSCKVTLAELEKSQAKEKLLLDSLLAKGTRS